MCFRNNTNCNILTEYQLISSANIEDAFTNHTDEHEIQNAQDFYAMLSNYITGTICDIVFEQAKNIPTNEKNIKLFNILT